MEEVKRKLASIRKVASVSPIEGSDNIELIRVDGWQCVAKKSEFAQGDLCIYFEIDSFLPIRAEFEFLRKSSYKKMGDKEGFRLKTIRLRGQLSQGLALPISSFPFIEDIFEGCDCTESIGVLKYDPPIPEQLAGICKGDFPNFIHKTDQERVQNIWNKIKDCGETFEVTIKLDGSSCTYYLKDDVFGVCSKNMDLKESEGNTFWKTARERNIEKDLRAYGKNIALQGEVIGEGIQGNPEKINGYQFHLFDIWDIDNYHYISPKERTLLGFHNFSTKHVPIIHEYMPLTDFSCLQDLLDFADGKSLYAESREGLVFKSNQSDLTFKVISNKFLLKEKD